MTITLLALLASACGDSGTDTATETSTDAMSEADSAVESFHPEDKGWELVWSDEFDGDQLDETKWGYEVNCWGGGNEEQQCYTDRPDNTYLSDGILHIRAQIEEFSGGSTVKPQPQILLGARSGFSTTPLEG